MKRLILFLIRKKLHVGKKQAFRFVNQRSKYDYYFIDDTDIYKCPWLLGYSPIHSNVSLHWLLSKECEIKCVE